MWVSILPYSWLNWNIKSHCSTWIVLIGNGSNTNWGNPPATSTSKLPMDRCSSLKVIVTLLFHWKIFNCFIHQQVTFVTEIYYWLPLKILTVLFILVMKNSFHLRNDFAWILCCVSTHSVKSVSYGMSGREQMEPYWDLVEDINVNGTRYVIDACIRNRVRGLVYTSTYNVVFGGQTIINGDESLPYFPLHRHSDNN